MVQDIDIVGDVYFGGVLDVEGEDGGRNAGGISQRCLGHSLRGLGYLRCVSCRYLIMDTFDETSFDRAYYCLKRKEGNESSVDHRPKHDVYNSNMDLDISSIVPSHSCFRKDVYETDATISCSWG